MRLLLIEDDKRVARFIQKGLTAERHRVELASKGSDGIEMGSTGVYDLILLDLILPEETGFEICRQLRENKIVTPILMLTARDSIEDKVMGLGVGADDYLTKPFAFEELLARIQALLRRPREMTLSPILTVTDLSLDNNTHEVKRAGKSIELTATEFGLLEYLMRRPNRALSRTMIEEQVWDYHFDSSSNVVDVYIRRLRKKVDHGYSQPLIHTVRGAGYMLKGKYQGPLIPLA
jgi:two-component system copper resistance phosphate regulon response regulator CusR